jgi:hypothetical protein
VKIASIFKSHSPECMGLRYTPSKNRTQDLVCNSSLMGNYSGFMKTDTKHHLIQTCIRMEQFTLVVRAIEPSPVRLFQYVSSHLFSYECMGLKYTLFKTGTEDLHAFLLNRELMKTQE